MKVSKPKLVENKVVEKILKTQQENKPFNYNFLPIVYTFVLKNIFVVSIFIFIGILLLYRYYYTQSKKKEKEAFQAPEASEKAKESVDVPEATELSVSSN